MKVRFTPGARAQFLAALDHIRGDDPQAALELRDRAAVSLSRLARFPESGRVVPEFPDLPFREVSSRPTASSTGRRATLSGSSQCGTRRSYRSSRRRISIVDGS